MKNNTNMRKDSKFSIIASILVFILFNLVFYNKMPEILPVHWNINNEVDSYSSKFFAMVILHGLMILLNIFLCFMLDHDPKNKTQNNFVTKLSKFSIPIFMIIIYIITISFGYGKNLSVGFIINILIGFLFIGIGNYMPKVKRNYTVGVKLPWTLNSDENWRRTQRLSGYLFIVLGFIFLISAFLNNITIIIGGIVVATIVPMIYSFYLYKKSI